MSTKLKAGTATSGAVIDADTTGILELQSGSTPTTAVTIDASQNVGINMTPLYKLDVSGANGNAIRFTDTLNGVQIANGGYNSTGFSGTLSNHPLAFYANASERMRIQSNGKVNIANTSTYDGQFMLYNPTYTWCMVMQDRGTTGGVQFLNSSATQVGAIYINSASTTYATSSDYRLKENIAPMTGGLDKVSALKPVTYTWKSTGQASQGFIAHELQEVCPEAVCGTKDEINSEGKPVYQGIDTSFLVATLTASIQELKAIVDAQAERIAVLEAK